ncbi:hypothetical protein AAF712_004105 [Marasmius tenuissimus]|uniref:Uncharacterized protein n=1 Tax=Marasmius tenuissimus TaxID=585030 RepID=A0ABR3A602_9AGAR|nr:hypothetical protein PM082_001639 [Marasmius tenuissimus]
MFLARSPNPDARLDPTPVFHVHAVSSSEAASLNGQKAKTPIIAGVVCGVVMGLAWIIGLFIYIRKRRRHKLRKRAAEAEGKNLEEMKAAKGSEPPEKIIIPRTLQFVVSTALHSYLVVLADPAVLLGHGKPGDYVLPEPDHEKGDTHPRPSLQGHESEPGLPVHRHDFAPASASEPTVPLARPKTNG